LSFAETSKARWAWKLDTIKLCSITYKNVPNTQSLFVANMKKKSYARVLPMLVQHEELTADYKVLRVLVRQQVDSVSKTKRNESLEFLIEHTCKNLPSTRGQGLSLQADRYGNKLLGEDESSDPDLRAARLIASGV
jgi:hypothetical protein